MKSILAIFGTRPEAVKFAPVIRELRRRSDRFDLRVAVTGVHRQSVDQVLNLFEIVPDDDFDLRPTDDDHAAVFAAITARVSELIAEHEPSLVLVLGDTVNTLAATLAAYYRQVPVAHIEAGLRVHDKFATFPEEGHRTMVTSTADLHFAPTENAKNNLRAEGIDDKRVFVTGNTVIDALHLVRERLEEMRSTRELKLIELFSRNPEQKTLPSKTLRVIRDVEVGERRMVLVTGSRRENLGSVLQSICGALSRLAEFYPEDVFIFPIELEDKVRKSLESLLADHDNIFLLPPLDYLPFVYLMQLCHFVLTDSGSIQEEGPALDKPVMVMRTTTDRPEAVASGSVQLVSTDAVRIVASSRRLMDDPAHHKQMADALCPYGDGHASVRIANIIERFLDGTLDDPDCPLQMDEY